MAIIIEDGTQVSSANSYVTEAELTAYATARGVTISGDTEQLLIKAMDYLEAQNFKGVKVSRDQPLQWPRASVYIDGYYVEADTIPNELKSAQNEVAIAIDAGEDPLVNQERAQESVSVGPISVTYKSGYTKTLVPRIPNALKKLVSDSAGNFIVGRG